MATKTRRKKTGEVRTVHFSVTGEFLTRHARSLWEEGSFRKAFTTLDCMIGMTKDQQIELLEGRKKLTGDSSEGVGFEDDDWTPPEGYPDFLTAMERAAPALLEELESRRRDEAHGLLDQVECLTRPGTWSTGGTSAQTKELRRRAERLIGATAVAEILENLREQAHEEEEEEPWHDDPDEEDTEDREAVSPRERMDPLDLLYAQAANQMQMAAIMSGGDPLAIPSPEAMMNRGMDLKPELDGKMESDSGWLLPDGKYYKCGNMEHIGLATNIIEPTMPKMAQGHINPVDYEQLAENRGWIKITKGMTGLHIAGKNGATKRQQTKLFDYCERRGLDYLKTVPRNLLPDT